MHIFSNGQLMFTVLLKELFDRCDETNFGMSSFCKINLGNDMTRPPLWGSLLLAQYQVNFFSLITSTLKKKFNCSLNNFCRCKIILYSGTAILPLNDYFAKLSLLVSSSHWRGRERRDSSLLCLETGSSKLLSRG